jgi:putative transposase
MVKKKTDLQKKIDRHSNKFKIPINNSFRQIETHSWFDIQESTENKLFNNIKLDTETITHDGYYTKRIKLILSETQEKILLRWMNCYILMCNETVRYFKKCKFNETKTSYSITQLKKLLKSEKDQISKLSEMAINDKVITINKHILDYAINDSLNRYQSCLTNLKNGNISYFRLRYLKQTKKNKILKIEKWLFKKNGFCVPTLGEIKMPGFNFLENILTTATIHYLNGEFSLLIKYKVANKPNQSGYKDNTISLDPGIRKAFTGYSNNKIIKIGSVIKKFVKRKIIKIDKIMNNKDISKKRRQIITNKIYKKIKNKIKDFHWKTIDYLTKNFKTILIGNFSTKSVNEKKDVSNLEKRIRSMYGFYEFKEKLKYKCKYTNTKYKEIDEAYTSKCCCGCSNFNAKFKDAEIYNCKVCKRVIDRDINGAINILINNLK